MNAKKVNNLGKEIPVRTNLININQYNTENCNLEKKIDDVDKKLHDLGNLVTTTVLDIYI